MSIFLDFDGTITTKDTVTHLANFALRFQSERQAKDQHKGSGDDDTSHVSSSAREIPPAVDERTKDEGHDLSSRWDDVVHAYVSDYKSHVSDYTPSASDRQCVEDEVTFLRSQKHVETRSLDRINECALFRGISPATFREAGRELVRDGTVRLRPGFADFVRRAWDKGWRVSVVSVNWSAAFIEGACGFAEGEISVFANEVREEDGVVLGPGVLSGDALLTTSDKNEKEASESRGQVGRNLTNSCDKRDAVREVRRKGNELDKPFYYFGDSTTDMECLLEATRGVVIADDEQSTLIQTLRRIGKRVPHVRDAESDEDLVWASDFEETFGVHV
ncbi:haloacid dehalogenase-like hydrolase-domain-containing protein [Xylaria arbuscula]|nr:haloacid dehalogenase-like hydrolase-domain-containing protein [Xylaria arbuscula]